jgi:membrane-associated phospholipid phosphatase
MNIEHDFRRLLGRTLLALAACLALVVGCYYWVDRPVAFYVYGHAINKIVAFEWLTYPPSSMQTWSPLVLVLLMLRRAWGPLRTCQMTLLVACVSLIVAGEFRTSLGGLCGRYWPETWFHVSTALADDSSNGGTSALISSGGYFNNPSLIGTGTYGFHAFQSGDDVGSFPSGHATRILAFATVFWIALPRSRAVWIVLCPPMLLALVAMDYHFVSDVIAGSVLGGIVGVYATSLANLRPANSLRPT